MYVVINLWTHNQFSTDSLKEAEFFASFDMQYTVMNRHNMQHVIV